MASEAPINCRNPRRETESSHSDAPWGNSGCSISWNSAEPASSSRLRQYSGPLVSASCCWTVARSSFLPGQTSSRFDLSFASSIFIASGFNSYSANVIAESIFDRIQTIFLAMTRAAARDVLYRTQLVFLDQCCSQRFLVGIAGAIDLDRQRCGWLLVAHVEHLVARAQILLRRAVAIETPLHLQRCLLIHQGHLVHWAMAVIAADTLCHVNAVIEINEVGQLVDARPLQRLTRSVDGAR